MRLPSNQRQRLPGKSCRLTLSCRITGRRFCGRLRHVCSIVQSHIDTLHKATPEVPRQGLNSQGSIATRLQTWIEWYSCLEP